MLQLANEFICLVVYCNKSKYPVSIMVYRLIILQNYVLFIYVLESVVDYVDETALRNILETTGGKLMVSV